MTETEYRVMHSKIIEECIYLKDIQKRYLALTNSEGNLGVYSEVLNDAKNKPMGPLINKYKNSDADFLFPKDFIERLEDAKDVRNYYAHKVFYQHTPLKNINAKEGDARKIQTDYSKLCQLHNGFCYIYDEKVKKLRKEAKMNG